VTYENNVVTDENLELCLQRLGQASAVSRDTLARASLWVELVKGE
jgi:hypothetical protein